MAQIDAELTFRAFDEKDFEPLAGLVGRTWLADFPVAAQRAAATLTSPVAAAVAESAGSSTRA